MTEIDRDQTRLARLELNGGGQITLAEGETLQQVDGQVGFDASGISLVNENLERLIRDSIGGTTRFDFTPGDVLRLSGMEISGNEYSLGGALTVDRLETGITLSTEGWSRAMTICPISRHSRGANTRTPSEITANFAVLTGAFDVVGDITGTDISVDNERLDILLSGIRRSTSLRADRGRDRAARSGNQRPADQPVGGGDDHRGWHGSVGGFQHADTGRYQPVFRRCADRECDHRGQPVRGR